MNTIVCIKTVPNPALPVEFDVEKGIFIEDEWNYILNPCDESSLGEALRLKEKHGGSISVITVDSTRGEETLRKCLSLGADSAIRVDTGTYSLFDSLTIARTLSRVIGSLPYDIIFCGDQSSDSNRGEVGVMLANLLDLPAITAVTQLEIDNTENSATVLKKLERGARERKRCPLPALFTAELILHEPLYPTLPGRKIESKQAIRVIDINSLDDIQNILETGAQRTRLISVQRPPPRKIFIPTGNLSPAERIRLLTQRTAVKNNNNNVLEGNPEEIAKKTVTFLKETRFIS
jgi:electron transfer flavoprotein beta subunit